MGIYRVVGTGEAGLPVQAAPDPNAPVLGSVPEGALIRDAMPEGDWIRAPLDVVVVGGAETRPPTGGRFGYLVGRYLEELATLRPPVGQDWEEFSTRWYSAQNFGDRTSYGYHEALDLNLRTGGSTDLGQPIYAIADGQVVAFHEHLHPEAGFGMHFVYRIEGPFGVRWIHCAHCSWISDAVRNLSAVRAGDVLAKVGATGRPPGQMSPHLHFAVFRVDPSTIPASHHGRTYRPIDHIAHDQSELNAWWEDPVAFFRQWAGWHGFR